MEHINAFCGKNAGLLMIILNRNTFPLRGTESNSLICTMCMSLTVPFEFPGMAQHMNNVEP